MRSSSIIQIICLLTSISCLGFAYLLAGYWLILLLILIMATLRIVMRKWSLFWSATILFFCLVLLAVAGMLANLSTSLMLVACTAALAWWDLTNFGQSIPVGQPSGAEVLLEKYHLQSLALAVSGGVILAIASSYLNLQIPFIGTVLLVLCTIGCLTYAMQFLVKRRF
jgi:hypothetical protein